MDIKKYIINSKKNCVNLDFDLYDDDTQFLDECGLLFKNGAGMIRLGFNKKNDSDVIKVGLKLRDLSSYYNAVLIVKKRVDIAKIIKADGIFLENSDMPIKYAADVLGHDVLIGTGYYSKEADFIFSSSSKMLKKDVPVFYLYSKNNHYDRIYFNKEPGDNTLDFINSI